MSLITIFERLVSNAKTKINRITQLTDTLRGPRGYLLFTTDDPSQPLRSIPVISKNPIVVNTDEEAQSYLGGGESFSNVFDTWKRISHLGVGPYPSNVNELDAWAYDEPTDTIRCTVNSSTMVGFISPDRHENYVFEATVKSTSSDDDSVGVCIAFTELDGVEHTLVAMRTPGGSQTHPNIGGDVGSHRAKLFDVYYDIFHPDRIDLGSKNGGLKWGDGTVNDDRLAGDIGGGGWSNHPDGCRIKVTREGDQFTLETTNLGESSYVSTATITFNLNDYPELAKFKGPQRYGYVSYSQTNASWETLKKPAVLNQVLVLEGTSYEWSGEQWVDNVDTQRIIDQIPNGTLLRNQSTRKLYYKSSSGTLESIGGR